LIDVLLKYKRHIQTNRDEINLLAKVKIEGQRV